jgi:formylglycine-generating enzyme required for sulfatase activity
MWAAVKDTTNILALEAFRQRYGRENPVYDRLAEERIEALKKHAMVAPPAPPKPPVLAFDPNRAPVPLTAAEERSLKPKDSFKECQSCPEMVVVPAGSFMMGASASEIAALKKEYANPAVLDQEAPQRKVTIARPFAVGKFEVTFAEWYACLAEGGCTHRPDDNGWGRGKRPVMRVSWIDITGQYLPWLSRKTGKTYRLLSEAEWEYAARADTTTRYAFGDTINTSQAQLSAVRTAEVGSFPANKFGLHDMHGNVWEWVEDGWHPDYKGAPLDGTVWASGDVSLRVLRGGAFNFPDPHYLRSAIRFRVQPTGRSNNGGFRVARTL